MIESELLEINVHEWYKAERLADRRRQLDFIRSPGGMVSNMFGALLGLTVAATIMNQVLDKTEEVKIEKPKKLKELK